jgi:hypothetical protein
MIEMEEDISKGLPTLTVADIPFDVRQNKCRKEFGIPASKARGPCIPKVRQIIETMYFWAEFSALFESKE